MDHAIAVFFSSLAHSSPFTEAGTVFFAQYFPYIVFAGFLYVAFRERRTFYAWCVLAAEGLGAAVIARGVVEVIRFFFHRPRPFIANSDIAALIEKTSASFPSGHAAFFFALATTVYLHNKKWGWWFFLASVIIGLARMMAGVHYLTDIIGGALLGSLVAWIVHKLVAGKTLSGSAPL